MLSLVELSGAYWGVISSFLKQSVGRWCKCGQYICFNLSPPFKTTIFINGKHAESSKQYCSPWQALGWWIHSSTVCLFPLFFCSQDPSACADYCQTPAHFWLIIYLISVCIYVIFLEDSKPSDVTSLLGLCVILYESRHCCFFKHTFRRALESESESLSLPSRFSHTRIFFWCFWCKLKYRKYRKVEKTYLQ